MNTPYEKRGLIVKIKSLIFAFLFMFVILAPQSYARDSFMQLTRDENGILTISGEAPANSLISMRFVYFGTGEPSFPNGMENYEISADDVNDGNVKVSHFGIVTADAKGQYSKEVALSEYGYYLITLVSNQGERRDRLYRYNPASDEMQPPGNSEKRNTEPNRIFVYGGKKFVLLNMGASESVLIPYSDCGRSNGTSIENYLANIPSLYSSEFSQYISSVELPDAALFEQYADDLGIADGVGYYGGNQWRVLSNAIDRRDVQNYAQANISELDDGLYMDNIRFDGNLTYISEKYDTETVIEFTAPEDGSYTVNTALSGVGSVRAQLTALCGEKTFDNRALMTVDYNGNSTAKNATVSLLAGEKVYLHLYPTAGEVYLNYQISDASHTYNLNDYGTYPNQYWTAGTNGDNGYAYSMNSTNFGQVVSVPLSESLFVRPVIYIDNDFFKNTKIDVYHSGADVLNALSTAYTKSELTQYDQYELATIFNNFEGFEFTELPFTDGNGNELTTLSNGVINGNVQITNNTNSARQLTLLLAVYTADGTLVTTNYNPITVAENESGIFSVGGVITNAQTGMCAKTFLWDSAGGMKPIAQIIAREPIVAKLTDVRTGNLGNWKFYTKALTSTDYSTYSQKSVTGSSTVSTGASLPMASWQPANADNNAYLRPESTGSQVIAYTVPNKGNWEIGITWRNVGVGTVYGGDGGSMNLSYLPQGDNDDSRVFKSLGVLVSTANPVSNSYKTVIKANGGDKILLSTYPNIDGYGDCWEVKYTISESRDEGKVIDEGYKTSLAQVPDNKSAAKTTIQDGIVWFGVDGTFADSEAMKTKILYIKQFVPNIGVVLMTGNPSVNCNADFYEENGIPTIVQSYGAGYENYINANGAWEWKWNNAPLDSTQSDDLAGSAHAFALPHFATREVFSRIAKSAMKAGYSGFGFPDYVWMWGARGVTGYNPETIKAFVNDLTERDGGLVCDDGTWYFHDYYRYYTGSDTMITPSDYNLISWENYAPLSQTQNTQLVNAGVDTTPYWGLFDMLCHYEWLKFAQYISNLSVDNDGICQIMINPEYYADGVDQLFLNKLKNVYMTEDEYFGPTDYLDGAYYRFNYINKYNQTTKTGGVMEAGGGGNSGAYYTNEIAYLTAFELGSLKAFNHLEADFMWQNAGFQAERDGQLVSYAMGFSAAKSLNLDKRDSDFVLVSSRNQARPWTDDSDWKPWSLRLGFDQNIDFYLAKMGQNFAGISQEGIRDISSEKVVVFSPNIVTEGTWNTFMSKLSTGSIETGILSAHRFDYAITEKLKTVAFSQFVSGYTNLQLRSVSSAGLIKDKNSQNLSSTQMTVAGGIYQPLSTDITVLTYNTGSTTYPLVVKRAVGNGQIYLLLFDDSRASNYAISELVYDYLLGLSGIKPMYKSITNTGTPGSGFTMTAANTSAVAADLGASVRVYESGDMTVAGIQNSLARQMLTSTLTSQGICAPYVTSGTTSAKVLMSPNTTYRYMAIPLMQEGTVTADSQGYVTLTFNNASHAIFFLLPQSSTQTFDQIENMQSQWQTALGFNVN